MKINYEALDDDLLKFVSPRILELSRQPFMRQGQIDFDIPYALSIWDAKDRVSLAALSINNPGESVYFPPSSKLAFMGMVIC